MIKFIESPMYDNWFKTHIPQKKLVICTPFMKQNALDRILKLYDVENQNKKLEIQVLIRGELNEFTYDKVTDFSVIETFLGIKNFNVDYFRRITNLHMKAYLVDDKELLITSGNMTESGMFVISQMENFEGGIATDEKDIICQFKNYFAHIWEQAERLEAFYDKLLMDYQNYLENEYSDREMVRWHIKRKKYQFLQKSELEIKTDEKMESEIDKLLPVGYIKYLDETLKILQGHSKGLSYSELGDLLRRSYNLLPGKNKKGNDTKFGEEKGKYAVYFGLANLIKVDGENKFLPNSFGKMYLNFDEAKKIKYLKDQLFSKIVICEILRQIDQNKKFELRTFLQKQYRLQETTLDRICAALKDLIKYLKRSNEEDELMQLFEKLQK